MPARASTRASGAPGHVWLPRDGQGRRPGPQSCREHQPEQLPSLVVGGRYGGPRPARRGYEDDTFVNGLREFHHLPKSMAFLS